MTNEWISVKDRLPESDGEYLSYRANEKFGKIGTSIYWNSLGSFNDWTVTHWQPLPPPPEV